VHFTVPVIVFILVLLFKLLVDTGSDAIERMDTILLLINVVLESGHLCVKDLAINHVLSFFSVLRPLVNLALVHFINVFFLALLVNKRP
jgi:hypothetical protein